MIELMRRALSEMTYSSLCLPENINARGLESIPNFYYRDDGLKLWNIINRLGSCRVSECKLNTHSLCSYICALLLPRHCFQL